MKKAFTLAEVLITLAVIGVVAALTIPTLVQKYQKKQMYTQFMKTYNAITNAIDNAIAEYDEPADWNWGSWSTNPETGGYVMTGGDDPAENYIYPQFKYIQKCDKVSDCLATTYGFISGGDSIDNVDFDDDYFTHAIVLPDGSVIAMAGDKTRINILFDTNGKNAPNVVGRDLFRAYYYLDESAGSVDGAVHFSEYSGFNCNPNSGNSGMGYACGSRLLQEGAMNY